MDELTRLVQEEGFEAVRFNPYLWPEGKRMTDERGKAMYKRCVICSSNRAPAAISSHAVQSNAASAIPYTRAQQNCAEMQGL